MVKAWCSASAISEVMIAINIIIIITIIIIINTSSSSSRKQGKSIHKAKARRERVNHLPSAIPPFLKVLPTIMVNLPTSIKTVLQLALPT